MPRISQLPLDAAPARTALVPVAKALGGGIFSTRQWTAAQLLALAQDSDLTFTDITTGNASAAAHGYLLKLSGAATDFLNGAGAWAVPAGSGGFSSSIYLNYQDQKAQNTQGGTFTSGAWQTRVLNTEVSDVGGLGTLASNQITLTAGTYLISAIAPARLCDRHQLRLQNVTDVTTLIIGQSAFESSGLGDITVAHLRGIFTVGASKALELQHQCQTTRATDGFGVAANFTTEVYVIVELWKVG